VLHRGKVIGIFIGYFLWGIPGVLIGLPLGYVVDKSLLGLKRPHYAKATPHELSRLHEAYLSATFNVMGYIAYKGGREIADETLAANLAFDRLQLPKMDRSQALGLFQQGKQPGFNVNDTLLAFYSIYRDQPELIEMFIELQLYGINLDHAITPSEKQALLEICSVLDLTKADFERIYSTIRTELQLRHSKKRNANDGRNKASLANAYAVLNTSPNATDDEIKRAYRRLRSVHHPDKLLGQGLPADRLKIAEDKTHEIRTAYEAIRTVRDL